MIEAKIGASFTENQPQCYLDELRKRCAAKPGHKAFLLLLVPERRRHSVWAEACRHATHIQNAEFRTSVHERVTMMLATWTELVEVLVRSEPLDPNTKWLLESFKAIVRTHINPELVHLDGKTMEALRQPATIEAAIALTNMVDDLKDRLASLQFTTTTSRAGPTWYGFYATPPGQVTLNFWVGYYHIATYELKRVDECPLWMQLTGGGFDNGCVTRLNARGRRVIEVDEHPNWSGWGGRIVALPLRRIRNSDAVIESVIGQITEILNVANNSETRDTPVI